MAKKIMNFVNQYLFHPVLLRVVGVGLFIYIVWMVDLKKVWFQLKQINLFLFILALSMSALILFMRSVRWNLIKKVLSINIPFFETMTYQLAGNVGFVTPGRFGEFIKAFYVTEHGFSLEKTVPTIVLDRICDLVVISFVAVIFLLSFGHQFGIFHFQIILFLAGGGLISLIILMFYFPGVLKGILGQVIKFTVPATLRDRFATLFETFLELVRKVTLVRGTLFLCISLMAYFIQVLQVYIFAYSLGMQVNFFMLTGIIAVVLIINLIPISFSGLGTREPVFLYFFGKIGFSNGPILSLSFVILFDILFFTACGVLLFSIRPPEMDLETMLAQQTDP